MGVGGRLGGSWLYVGVGRRTKKCSSKIWQLNFVSSLRLRTKRDDKRTLEQKKNLKNRKLAFFSYEKNCFFHPSKSNLNL